jgi:hypothetical protein
MRKRGRIGGIPFWIEESFHSPAAFLRVGREESTLPAVGSLAGMNGFRPELIRTKVVEVQGLEPWTR